MFVVGDILRTRHKYLHLLFSIVDISFVHQMSASATQVLVWWPSFFLGGVVCDEMKKAALIQACVGEFKVRLMHHRLQLNYDMTEVLVIATLSSASKHNLTYIVICESILQPAAVGINIGVMFDSELNMTSQVLKLCQIAYFHLDRIRSTRDCLTQPATELLVHSLVTSRLDYGNGLQYGVPY